MRIGGIAAAAAAALFLLVAAIMPATAQAVANDYVGTWQTQTNLGDSFTLTLSVSGTDIDGSYKHDPPNGTPDGQLAGVIDPSSGTLYYNWQLGTAAGAGTFNLSGDTLTGTWGTTPDDPSKIVGTWNGTRRMASNPFVGEWKTKTTINANGFTDTYTLWLMQSGTAMAGTYRHDPPNGTPDGQVSGILDGSGGLIYNWQIGTLSGAGRFTLVGDNLTGVWGTTPNDPTQIVGKWGGPRVKGGSATPPPAPVGGPLPAPSGLSGTIKIGGITITIGK